MIDTELFNDSKKAIEKCQGIRQAFLLMPPQTQLSLLLENRVACTLSVNLAGDLDLQALPATSADFEFIVYSESIRRLNNNSPDDVLVLFKEIAALRVGGHLKWKTLSTPADIYRKGYVHALKNLPPELQKEALKYGMGLMMYANQSVENLKSLFRK